MAVEGGASQGRAVECWGVGCGSDVFQGVLCVLVLLDLLLGLVVVGGDEGAAHGALILFRLDARHQLRVATVRNGRRGVWRAGLRGRRQRSEGDNGRHVLVLLLLVVFADADCRVVSGRRSRPPRCIGAAVSGRRGRGLRVGLDGRGGRGCGRLLPLVPPDALLDALHLLDLAVYLVGEALFAEAHDVENKDDHYADQHSGGRPGQEQLPPRVRGVGGAQHVVDLHLFVAEREEGGDEVVERHAGDVRRGGAQQPRVRPHEGVGAHGGQQIEQDVRSHRRRAQVGGWADDAFDGGVVPIGLRDRQRPLQQRRQAMEREGSHRLEASGGRLRLDHGQRGGGKEAEARRATPPTAWLCHRLTSLPWDPLTHRGGSASLSMATSEKGRKQRG